MPVDPTLLGVHHHAGPGYLPLVDYATWRVAVLNACDELLPARLDRMQRHDETDEVFVLLAGRCILFVGEDDGPTVGTIHAVDLVPGRVYNVRRGVWHTHTLDATGSVLVVENRDTTEANSPFASLSADQTAGLVADTARLWGDKA